MKVNISLSKVDPHKAKIKKVSDQIEAMRVKQQEIAAKINAARKAGKNTAALEERLDKAARKEDDLRDKRVDLNIAQDEKVADSKAKAADAKIRQIILKKGDDNIKQLYKDYERDSKHYAFVRGAMIAKEYFNTAKALPNGYKEFEAEFIKRRQNFMNFLVMFLGSVGYKGRQHRDANDFVLGMQMADKPFMAGKKSSTRITPKLFRWPA